MSAPVKDRSPPGGRALWNATAEARETVAAWPAWKRGESDRTHSPIREAVERILDKPPESQLAGVVALAHHLTLSGEAESFEAAMISAADQLRQIGEGG